MANEIHSADDICRAIETLRWQLEQLAQTGRIVMSRDSGNTVYPDSGEAIRAALTGLDRAVHAMRWMETLPTTDGNYPPLKG